MQDDIEAAVDTDAQKTHKVSSDLSPNYKQML